MMQSEKKPERLIILSVFFNLYYFSPFGIAGQSLYVTQRYLSLNSDTFIFFNLVNIYINLVIHPAAMKIFWFLGS
jgi:hypothetical protein